MRNTHESSMAVYNRLIENPIPGPPVQYRPMRDEIYSAQGRHTVAIVRTEDRGRGIEEALRLMGGLGRLVEGVQGEVVIKPNCNTDDPFPRNSHHETVRCIAEGLIAAGLPAERICVGDMSGRFRGLPTRNTMEEMGLRRVADELGIQLACFEEEDWVTVRLPRASSWPDGVKIPRRIYEADRIVLTPIMRPHRTPVFTIATKLSVGLIDPVGREWLHWNRNQDFMNRMIDINLAFTADLVITDGMEIYTDMRPPDGKIAKPGLIIAGSNRIAADAVAVCVMKQNGAHGMIDAPVREHLTFKIGEERGLGSSSIGDIELRASNLAEDPDFDGLLSMVREELV